MIEKCEAPTFAFGDHEKIAPELLTYAFPEKEMKFKCRTVLPYEALNIICVLYKNISTGRIAVKRND